MSNNAPTMNLSSSNVSKSYTIKQFISFQSSDPVTYSTLSLWVKSISDKNIIYSYDNILYDYLDELKMISYNIEMTNEEFRKYKYKPKLLAYDIYGATELYFIILAINGIKYIDVKAFDKRKLRLPKANDLANIVTAIYNAETTYLNANRNSLNEE